MGGGKRDECEREEERRELLTPSRRGSRVVWILNLKELLSGQRWRPSIRSPPYGSTLATFTRDLPPSDRPTICSF